LGLFLPRPAVFDLDLAYSLVCRVCCNYAQSTVTAADNFKRLPPIERASMHWALMKASH